ncbi:NAD(P)-binding protein [Mycena capillaripes]|nr:NAD(P)-binding protein [Mycena capillaripes]
MSTLLAKIAPNSALSTDLYPPPSKFEPERDIPDLSGKVSLVTGGNAGIGYHTVKQLLLQNAKVYLAARSADKAAEAIRMLEADTGRKAIFLQLDLADLASVRRAATTFLSDESRLDILFNNGRLTAQNQDLQFGTNVTGHYFLTELLVPAFAASYEVTGIPARIINTSSSGHKEASPDTGIDFSAPVKQVIKTYIRQAAAHSDILVSCALHPGSVRTDLQKHLPGWMQHMLDIVLPLAPMGPYTQLWAGTTATPEQINCQYLIPWARIGKADSIALSRKLEEETIAWLKEQVRDF